MKTEQTTDEKLRKLAENQIRQQINYAKALSKAYGFRYYVEFQPNPKYNRPAQLDHVRKV